MKSKIEVLYYFNYAFLALSLLFLFIIFFFFFAFSLSLVAKNSQHEICLLKLLSVECSIVKYMHIVIQKINYFILVKLKYCSSFSICAAKANTKRHIDQTG